MSDLSIKVSPKTRDQRRELDRAAKAAGLKTGPWCLMVALEAARGSEVVPLVRPAKLPSGDVGSNGGDLEGVVPGDGDNLMKQAAAGYGHPNPSGLSTTEPRRHPVPTGRRPILQSYEPDTTA